MIRLCLLIYANVAYLFRCENSKGSNCLVVVLVPLQGVKFAKFQKVSTVVQGFLDQPLEILFELLQVVASTI